MTSHFDRRAFLKTTAAAGALAAAGGVPLPARAGAVPRMALLTSTAQFDPVRPEAARVIAREMEAIGWGVDATPLDYNQGIQKVIMEHDYDMFLVRLSGQSVRIDPDVFLYQVHHTSQYRAGGFNWTGYSNPEVDELVAAQRQEMDVATRQALVYEAQARIADDQPNAVLMYPKMTNAYRSDRLRNMVPMMGEGIGSIWTDVGMEVVTGDGYVRTGATSPIKNLNPIATKDALEFMELRMIYDRLFQVGPSGTAEPWAAEGFTLVDATTIDITLRPGMKFHDGVDVTAEDVKFSFDYQKEVQAPFIIKALEEIETVEITGPLAVRLKLVKPFAPLFNTLLSTMFIIPKHIWEKIPDEVDVDDALNYANTTPIGSGPFKFDYWNRGAELKVTAFEGHHHQPKCAGIIRIVYGSHDAMAAAIERNECDRTRYILNPVLMLDLNQVPGVVGEGYPGHGMYVLSYNTKKAPFNDPAFRRALQYMFPREVLTEIVMNGQADPGGSMIAPVNAFWHNPEVPLPGQDIDRAKRILADAGYTWSGGQLMLPG